MDQRIKKNWSNFNCPC